MIEDIGLKLWSYIDAQGDVQGPFSSGSMRAWDQAGYLPPDLLIRFGDGDYVTLEQLEYILEWDDVPFALPPMQAAMLSEFACVSSSLPCDREQGLRSA